MPSKKTLGYIAISCIVCIWSGWIVTTRSGATSNLTIYDIAAIRFGISSLVVLPISLYFKPWRTISWPKMLTVSQLLGIPYFLSVLLAFKLAPAAHGGIFMNGVLPAITLILGWLCFRDKPALIQLFAATLIIIGASVTLFGTQQIGSENTWIGDLLFILSAVFFCFYMVLSKLWLLTPMQILFATSVVNGAIFMPIWYFFLPSGLAEASTNELALQILYQGFIATFVGMLLVAFAVRHIGAPISSAFMSAVPTSAAVLGFVILGEEFGFWGWVSLAILTPGILIMAFSSREKEEATAIKNPAE